MIKAFCGRTLDTGLSIEARDKDGRTAFLAAAEAGHALMVKALVRKGCDLETRVSSPENFFRHSDFTALMLAAWNGHKDVVRAIISAGAKINATKVRGGNALSCAVHCGHADVVRILLKRGAELPKFALY